MTNAEIIRQYTDNWEYPETYHRDDIEKMLDHARKDERATNGYVKYLKSEYDLQVIKMKALGINTDGQFFEQMVNALIYMVGDVRKDEAEKFNYFQKRNHYPYTLPDEDIKKEFEILYQLFKQSKQ